MNLLHISDMHFGPRHWLGNNEILLKKLNSYAADIVINTGDNTTDSLEDEYKDSGCFLKSIDCRHVISIAGNHDKRNMRSPDFFRQYIEDVEVVRPINRDNCRKNKLYLDPDATGIKEYFTDINFLKNITINGESYLVVCLDSNEFYKDNGYVDKEILRSVSQEISKASYDKIFLLNHHSILDTDSDPLFNSNNLIEFVREHNIKHVFCGHTHKLSIKKCTDLYYKNSFTQYKNGSLSGANTPDDTNMFIFYENFDTEAMKIRLVRVLIKDNNLEFKEEVMTLD